MTFPVPGEITNLRAENTTPVNDRNDRKENDKMNDKKNGKKNGKQYEDDWNPFGERTLVGAINQERNRAAIIFEDAIPRQITSADGQIAKVWLKE
jgi:hypothetical protein